MKGDFKRILVPLDGSPGSEKAVAAVRPFFGPGRSEATLLHVLEDEDATYLKPALYLGRIRDALAAEGTQAEYDVRRGTPAESILSYAREAKADLISMSTHGRGGLRRALLGSVTESVLRRADAPLLVTRPESTFPEWRRFVVGLDGSATAEGVLPEVVRVARPLGAEVYVVMVSDPLVVGGEFGMITLPYPAGDPVRYLDGVCERLSKEGVGAHPVSLLGHAVPELVGYAEKLRAGLIFLTTQGRTGLARLWLGSTAEAILRRAPCPVLVRRGAPVTVPAPA